MSVDNVVIVFHLGRIQIFRRMFYTIDIYKFEHVSTHFKYTTMKCK